MVDIVFIRTALILGVARITLVVAGRLDLNFADVVLSEDGRKLAALAIRQQRNEDPVGLVPSFCQSNN